MTMNQTPEKKEKNAHGKTETWRHIEINTHKSKQWKSWLFNSYNFHTDHSLRFRVQCFDAVGWETGRDLCHCHKKLSSRTSGEWTPTGTSLFIPDTGRSHGKWWKDARPSKITHSKISNIYPLFSFTWSTYTRIMVFRLISSSKTFGSQALSGPRGTCPRLLTLLDHPVLASLDEDAAHLWSNSSLQWDDVFNVQTFPGGLVKRRNSVTKSPTETLTQDKPQLIAVHQWLPLPRHLQQHHSYYEQLLVWTAEWLHIITHAGCIAAGVGRAFSRVCLSVCLFVRANRKAAWAINTKLGNIYCIAVARNALTHSSKGQTSHQITVYCL